MQDFEFHDLVDEIFDALEDSLEELPEDIDIDVTAGILTLEFPNGTTIIFSRQIANHEIWIAAKSGGFHLALQEGSQQWHCATTDETLPEISRRVVSEQLGREVGLL